MSWSDFDFIDSPIVVWGIHTEPGETTTQALLVTKYVVATYICMYTYMLLHPFIIHNI